MAFEVHVLINVVISGDEEDLSPPPLFIPQYGGMNALCKCRLNTVKSNEKAIDSTAATLTSWE